MGYTIFFHRWGSPVALPGAVLFHEWDHPFFSINGAVLGFSGKSPFSSMGAFLFFSINGAVFKHFVVPLSPFFGGGDMKTRKSNSLRNPTENCQEIR